MIKNLIVGSIATLVTLAIVYAILDLVTYFSKKDVTEMLHHPLLSLGLFNKA